MSVFKKIYSVNDQVQYRLKVFKNLERQVNYIMFIVSTYRSNIRLL